MNLRTKLLLGIGLALVATFTIVGVVSYLSMEQSYRSLETQEMTRLVQTTENTLKKDMAGIYSVDRDYAAWNETYAFAQDRNPSWIDDNMADDFFTRFNINYVLIFNRSDMPVYSNGYNGTSGENEPVPPLLINDFSNLNRIQHTYDSTSGTYGFLDSPGGLVIVSSHPILTDSFEGPAAGSLHLVRKIDDQYLADLSSRSGANVTLIAPQQIAAGSPLAATVSRISGTSPVAVVPLDDNSVAGYAHVDEIQSAGGFYIGVVAPRTIYQTGQQVIGKFLATLFLAAVFIIVFVLLFVDRVVLSRLNRIIGTVSRRCTNGDGDSHAIAAGRDELEELALEIDPVFSELASSRQELRESEERYRALAESAHDLIFIIDREDRIRYVNAFAAAAAGKKPEDLAGNLRSGLFPGPENERQREHIRAVFETGKPMKAESRIPLESGSTGWYDTLLVPLRDRTGTITGVMGVSRDITARKRTEEALRQSEMRFHELFELGGEAVLLVDNVTLRILEANTAASELYGFSHDELLSLRIAALSAEQEETAQVTEASESGSIMIPLRYHRKKGGSVFPVEINARFFMLEGRSVHVAAIRDITFRKQVEESLLGSNERFQTLLDSLDAFVYVADMASGEILFLNEHARKIWGDAAGRKCWEMVHEGRPAPCPFCTNERLIDESGNPTGVVVSEYHHPANGRYYECRDRAIRWTDKRIVRMTIATDITDRKRMEDAVVQVNKKLNLLSGITRHDILNQLTALKLLIELSTEHAKDELLSDIISKELKIANVIDRQISFTRDYHNLGVTAPVWQNVKNVILMAEQQILFGHVKVTVEFFDLEVFADPLLEKVFFNLMDNAMKYGGERMTEIRFSARRAAETVVIVCEDNGNGVAPENKEQIFTRGYAHHTGLGLFLSREILGITGMTIAENGTAGRGARFEITVPKGVYRFTGNGIPQA